MLKIFLVGAGGFIGAILRYIMINLITKYITTTSFFPLGTLFVNIIGCFLIGYGYDFFQTRQIINPELRSFIFIGILGSFTTYSTLGYESYSLFKSGYSFSSICYISLHLFGGLFFIWLGNNISGN